MKKKIILILLIIFICGCSYDPYEIPKDVYINIQKDNINVYDKKKVKDIVKDSNVKITNQNKYLNTNKINKQEVIIDYIYKKRKYKYRAKYNVIDNEKPILINYSSNKTIIVNEEKDFCKNISYIDNYDRNPKCKITGDINYNEVGTYYLKYNIIDSSNNTLEEDLTVNIVNEINEDNGSYTPEVKEFSDIINNYKKDNTMIGIDVSEWQGDIDFNKLKENGCEFVIIRMAFSSHKNEDLKLDKYYKTNIKNAKKAGLKVGVYFYTNTGSINEINKQSKFILKQLKGYKLELPIAYDFESWNDFNELHLNSNDLDNLYSVFEKNMNKKGYKTMLYSSKYYLEKVWLNKNNSNIWLAHYTDNTNYDKEYMLWQMSNSGRINGIYGDVDIDILYKK